MKINRMSLAAGLTVGVLAGGAAGAIAETASGSGPARTSSMAPSGSGRYGYGWGDGGTTRRETATRMGWGAERAEPAAGTRGDW